MYLLPRVNSLRLQKAFTLIEMLVVMIIMAMLVTLIVQGFGYSLGLYQRVVKTQSSAYQQAMAYHWFTSSLQSQVAMRPKDRGLEGDGSQLSTYSYRPLLGTQGLKTLVQWEIVSRGRELTLMYHEGAQRFLVYTWQDATGRFEYMDEKKQWLGDWVKGTEDVTSLPHAVRLQIYQGGEVLNYVANTETRPRSIITAEERMYGRE